MRTNILFDLDGTIIDPAQGITGAARHALEAMGYEVSSAQELERFIGPPLDETFSAEYGMDDAQIADAVLHFRDYFSRQGIYEHTLYEGFDTLIQTLAGSGYTLYLATSKPTPFARTILEGYGLAGYFADIQGSSLEGPGTPKGEIIRQVLENNRIHPDSAIMVGDRKHDVLGAKQNSLPCIGVLFGYAQENELQQAECDFLAANVQQLQQLLAGSQERRNPTP